MADNKVLVKAPSTLMFGRAINYALSAWNHLLNYLDCPELFVDNSIAERIENAKLYKLDPYEYLRCIFDQAPFCESEKDFEKLLPWNIKITEFNEEGTWKTDA